MRNKLITGIAVFVIALVGTGLGSVVGRLVPSAGGTLFDGKPASAQGLTAQPAGPLTPSPLGSGFTYQGKLLNNGSPVSGSYDFTFRLYDEAVAGALVSGPISVTSVISNGLFTANLDFGSPATTFNGDARYLEIATRLTGGGAYTTLSPRQPITPAPYALYALKTKGYKYVVTVAQDGGDFTSVTAALNSITNNSSTNRYLVWIAPGTYSEQVQMKPYVDIEGAGELATTITYVGSSISGPGTGTVIGANNAELRSLTVRNTGGNLFAIGFFNNIASTSLLHVTVTASGATSNTFAVYNSVGTPNMKDVTIVGSGGATCWGIFNNASSPAMDHVTSTCTGGSSFNAGIYNYSYGYSAPAAMRNVIATASGGAGSTNYGIRNDYSHFAIMDNFTATASGAATNNYGVYNFNATSPIMSNVTITASGGTSLNYGVFNTSSSPRMSNMTITASGGAGSNYGVYNTSSSPIMSNLDIIASGGNGTIGVLNISSSPSMNGVVVAASSGSVGNYGLYNEASSATVQNSSLGGSGGTLSYGLYNNASSGSYTVKVDNSTLLGSVNSIRSDIEYTTRVGASKLDGGTVSANGGVLDCAASYDGNNTRLGALCTPDTRVLNVAITGGDFTSIQAALNSITDNSSINRYLVRVGPGNYIERVTMKPYVDIEGAGEDVTKIVFTGSSSLNTGTVVGANNAELRFLTAENIGSNTWAVAIFNNATSPGLLHVTALASGGSDTSYGIANFSSSVKIDNVTIAVTGSAIKQGIYNFDSTSVRITDVVITASGGTYNTGVLNVNSSVTMTNLMVTVLGGTNDSFGVYNSSLATVMNNVIANVSGGANSFGVYNNASSPTMNNVTAYGSGATTGNYGIANYNSLTANLNYVTATGSGGANGYGIHNYSSTPIIRNSTITASGGTNNYGMYNSAVTSSYTIAIDNSILAGSTNTIRNDSHFIVRVGSSKLEGGAVLANGGTITCAGVHNENYAFFASTCP